MPLPPLVEPLDDLGEAERERTARHLALAGFGDLAQRRLAAAHVAIVGAGGLGAPAILALAAAGVGTITVVDDDDVELANLHRQVIHRLSDVGSPKVDSAVRVAADLSPETELRGIRRRLTPDNAAGLLAGADLVLDGSDTVDTRAAVAAACEELGVPLVWGVVQEFHAQVTVFWSAPPAGVPAVRLADLHPPDAVGAPPSCAQVGVLGAVCLQVGALMAGEAIKLVTGIGEPLLGRIALIDALRGRQSEVPLRASGAATAPAPSPVAQLDVDAALAAVATGAVLLDVREPEETATGVIPGAVLVPLAEVLADPARAGDGPLVVVCEAGVRAQRAATALRASGRRADVLAGGMAAWRRR